MLSLKNVVSQKVVGGGLGFWATVLRRGFERRGVFDVFIVPLSVVFVAFIVLGAVVQKSERLGFFAVAVADWVIGCAGEYLCIVFWFFIERDWMDTSYITQMNSLLQLRHQNRIFGTSFKMCLRIQDPIELNLKLLKLMVHRWIPHHQAFRDVVMSLGFGVGGLEVPLDESIWVKKTSLKELIKMFNVLVHNDDIDVDVSLNRCNKKILTGDIVDSLSISGSVVVLQLWAYERLGLYVHSSHMVFPRILRFHSLNYGTEEIDLSILMGLEGLKVAAVKEKHFKKKEMKELSDLRNLRNFRYVDNEGVEAEGKEDCADEEIPSEASDEAPGQANEAAADEGPANQGPANEAAADEGLANQGPANEAAADEAPVDKNVQVKVMKRLHMKMHEAELHVTNSVVLYLLKQRINHHGQSILLGCGLLSSMDTS
ncbi:hypothetical protein V8G54_030760 [Vigna mungo]|uniref:Uncharacterized protein n=1 Tax=Vigna mungo TaxID=3915 RepID=A0AAQ3MXM4_VIGMU